MVLDYTDNIRVTLQTTNLCATYAQETSCLVVDTIIRMRNEQDAATFYKIVKIRADLEKPSLPRKQKVPNIVNFLYGYILTIMKMATIFTVLSILQQSIMKQKQLKTDLISQFTRCMST